MKGAALKNKKHRYQFQTFSEVEESDVKYTGKNVLCIGVQLLTQMMDDA